MLSPEKRELFTAILEFEKYINSEPKREAFSSIFEYALALDTYLQIREGVLERYRTALNNYNNNQRTRR